MAKKTQKTDMALQKRERLAARTRGIAGLYVPLLFVLLPLAFGPQRYQNITEAKLWTFFVLAGLFAAALLLLVIFELPARRAGSLKALPAALRPYEWALAAYLVFLLVSSLASLEPPVSFMGASARGESTLLQAACVGTALALGRLYMPKERDLLLFCAVASLVAAYGLCQYYGLDFLAFFPEGYDHAVGPGMYFFSTMSNVNVASAYLGLAFCLAFVGFARCAKFHQRFYLPAGVLLFYALLVTRTDSAYLGLAVALALCFALVANSRRAAARMLLMLGGCCAAMWLNIAAHRPDWPENKYLAARPFLLPGMLALLLAAALLWFWPIALPKAAGVKHTGQSRPPNNKPRLRSGRRAWLLGWGLFLLAAAVLMAAFAPALARATGSATMAELAAVLRGSAEDSFGTGRVGVWRQTLALITPARLPFGYGPDMFGTVYLHHYGGAVLEAGAEILDKAHNEYLQLLFEEGLLALLALVAAWGFTLWRARRALGQTPALAVFVGLIFWLVQAFFNIATPFTQPLAWAFWGIGAAWGVWRQQQ